jgi:hypothetical protein
MLPRPMPVCRGRWSWPYAVVLGAPPEAEIENISCPAGSEAKGDAEGNVWCEDPTGKKLPATLIPVKVPTLGVVGWGVAIAGALLIGAALVGQGRGRR